MPEITLADLKARADLVQYARDMDGLDLKRAGKWRNDTRYRALCPFHAEKTPSLSVAIDRFYCHGCGVGGSILDYVMLRRQVTLREAVAEVAAWCGIEIGDNPLAILPPSASMAERLKERKWEELARQAWIEAVQHMGVMRLNVSHLSSAVATDMGMARDGVWDKMAEAYREIDRLELKMVQTEAFLNRE